jgi:hypothetical protein
MILITSAAYVNSEFQIEFGKIPPSFLPVGNKRLFEHQIGTLKKFFPEEKIFISSPLSYRVAKKDSIYLANEGISIVQIDPNISLGSSIAYFIDSQKFDRKQLKILHGDTLINDLPVFSNCIGTAKTLSGYDWEIEEVGDGGEVVWCGFFSFENPIEFRKSLQATENDFVSAIYLYDQQYPLVHREVVEWHDYGHLNTYFQNRAFLTTERSFNQLRIKNGSIKKYGIPTQKIKAESYWFKNIPPNLRVHIPNYIDDGLDFYELEYLPLPPLNELYVHGRNIELFWVKAFSLCEEFFEKCSNSLVDKEILKLIQVGSIKLIKDKTLERFTQFLSDNKEIDPHTPILFEGTCLPSLMQMIEECIGLALNIKASPGISHGDFCLSNILFDSRIDRIKVIDPRGLDADGRETVWGDINYDIAKLSHSILGLYDFIVSGAFDVGLVKNPGFDEYSLTIYIDNRIKNIQKIFLNKKFVNEVGAQEVMPITMLLFISMLPLHKDDPKRQMAFLANAIRIYKKYLLK